MNAMRVRREGSAVAVGSVCPSSWPVSGFMEYGV